MGKIPGKLEKLGKYKRSVFHGIFGIA